MVPFSGMLAAPNALVIDGGEATVKLAEAVLPVPPLVEAHSAGGVGVLPGSSAGHSHARMQLAVDSDASRR